MTNTVQRFPHLPEVRNQGQPLGEPVYWLGNQWAVTRDGIERRDGLYVIEPDRVWEGGDTVHGWEAHIRRKGSKVDVEDFRAALAFARARWPDGAPIPDDPKPRRPGTYPQLKCMIAWDPVSANGRRDRVAVGPHPDVTGWSDRYQSTDGACYAHLHTAEEWKRIAHLFVTFNTLVVRDGLDPQAVHRAFLAVDEYRARIAPDTVGADP